MTAVVGILNKEAIAIAADSAVTLSSGKIFNKANKIFTLSKYHPVGITLHNNASLMGTPWETIIKMYRKQLKDTSFDTLKMYQEDFIRYVKEKHFFCDVDTQRFQLNIFLMGINGLFWDQMGKEVDVNAPDIIATLPNLLTQKAQAHIDRYTPNNNILPDFVNYTFDNFSDYVENALQEIIDLSYTQRGVIINEELRTLLKQAYFSELRVKEFDTSQFTGIVFSGFGETEFFPSVIPLNVYFGFEEKLRYYLNEEKGAIISHNSSSAICTFAQSDVMFTILTGIAPELKETYNLNFRDFLSKFDDILLQNFEGNIADLQNLLAIIDKNNIARVFRELMEDAIQKKYVNPLFEAISGLGKEDLAEMAESLVYLTNLQRKITNAEESVGGPVDVAIITKGDGFVWIKRKHYFKAELNQDYFKKYFI